MVFDPTLAGVAYAGLIVLGTFLFSCAFLPIMRRITVNLDLRSDLVPRIFVAVLFGILILIVRDWIYRSSVYPFADHSFRDILDFYAFSSIVILAAVIVIRGR